MYACQSGSAADCEAVSQYVRHYASQHAAEIDRAKPSVESVARLVQHLAYNNKQLVAAMIIAGWDADKGGQVFGSPIGGTLMPEPWAIDGSGSTYIWSYFDDEYRPGMTREETEQLVKDGIAHAMARDGSSGGVVRLVTITGDGVEKKVFTAGKGGLPLIYGDMAEPHMAAA